MPANGPATERAKGALLGGRYWLDDEIASGGMATVHLGRMVGPAGFSRTVAIKRLHPHLANDPAFGSTLLDEARLAARVQHPSVVSALDVVAAGGELFLVMDYVVGESLSYLVRLAADDGGRLPVPVAIGIMTSVLGGLHAAHEARSVHGEPLALVHRDVSPQNVIVGSDGIARLLDFGIAKAAFRLNSTRDGQLKGKLRYMAPEQLHAGRVDRRADVYAASVVLWEALTGRALFSSQDAGPLVREILHGDVPAPSQFVAGLPAGLDDVVLRGLARDPQSRFPTAMEMIEALEHVENPATSRVIGKWVASTAFASLAARAALLARIESGSAQALPAPPPPTADLPTQLDIVHTPPATVTAAISIGRTAPPIRRVASWAAIIVLASLGAVALGSSLRERAPIGTTPSSGVGAAVPSVELPSSPNPTSAPPITAPSATAVATPKAHTGPGHTAPSKNCNPPWVLENGNKRFKVECL
ncbi:serine/threonine protein kinase [Labilithrix luteola]|uniref:Serine/threonine protein kinase n=1 Tax=Labilithrix luteola TaxID=1391654 RepID=A0A0K1Q730_9BACT|nr:serine/threonine-protein kinase [Labilithrix luteola]AKV01529.1 serine/threonine protein kinase [Labilithrix luteola]